MTKISLSIQEAATLSSIGKTKIYAAINSGELIAKKYGKSTLILKNDLENFLSNLPSYSSDNQGGQNNDKK